MRYKMLQRETETYETIYRENGFSVETEISKASKAPRLPPRASPKAESPATMDVEPARLFAAAVAGGTDGERPEGYDLSLFVEPVEDELQCPICHQALKDPQSCREGHVFCGPCIKLGLSKCRPGEPTCPLDRAALPASSLNKSLIAEQWLGKRMVRCPWRSVSDAELQQVKAVEDAILASRDAKDLLGLKEGELADVRAQQQKYASLYEDSSYPLYGELAENKTEVVDSAEKEVAALKAECAAKAKAVADAGQTLRALREAQEEQEGQATAAAAAAAAGTAGSAMTGKKRKALGSGGGGCCCDWVGPLEAREQHLRKGCKAVQLANRRALAQSIDAYGRTRLWMACDSADLAGARQLVADGADVNRAAKRDEVDESGDVDEPQSGSTPLHRACKQGSIEIAKLLVAEGAQVDKTDDYDESPLIDAVKNDNVEIVAFLAGKGANLNACDADGERVFDIALDNDLFETAKVLVTHGCNLMDTECDGWNALVEVLRGVPDESVREELALLILDKGGAKIVDAVSFDHVPLSAAIRHDSGKRVLAALLDRGAKVDAGQASSADLVAVHAAMASKTCADAAAKAVEAALDVAPDNKALLLAQKAEAAKAVDAAAKAVAAAREEVGGARVITPMYAACLQGETALVTSFLAKGASVNRLSNCQRTPMHAAAESGSLAVVEVLLANDAEPDVPDGHHGLTPFAVACALGHVDIARLLLGKGADVNALVSSQCYGGTDDWHEEKVFASSPLGMACAGGHSEIVRLLLAEGGPGVEVAEPDALGRTPFLLACENDHASCAYLIAASSVEEHKFLGDEEEEEEEFFIHRVDLSLLPVPVPVSPFMAKDAQKCSALHVAVQSGGAGPGGGSVEIAKLLMQMRREGFDIDLDEYDEAGRTPLIVASDRGLVHMVSILLAGARGDKGPLGAKIRGTAEDHVNKTNDRQREQANGGRGGEGGAAGAEFPLHAAVAKRHWKTAKVLLTHGARVDKTLRGGNTLLFEEKDVEAARFLVAWGADVDFVGTTTARFGSGAVKRSALHQAVARGEKDLAALLLAAGANPDKADKNGTISPPMLSCCVHSHWEIAAMLAMKGK